MAASTVRPIIGSLAKTSAPVGYHYPPQQPPANPSGMGTTQHLDPPPCLLESFVLQNMAAQHSARQMSNSLPPLADTRLIGTSSSWLWPPLPPSSPVCPLRHPTGSTMGPSAPDHRRDAPIRQRPIVPPTGATAADPISLLDRHQCLPTSAPYVGPRTLAADLLRPGMRLQLFRLRIHLVTWMDPVMYDLLSRFLAVSPLCRSSGTTLTDSAKAVRASSRFMTRIW